MILKRNFHFRLEIHVPHGGIAGQGPEIDKR